MVNQGIVRLCTVVLLCSLELCKVRNRILLCEKQPTALKYLENIIKLDRSKMDQMHH